MLSTRTDFDNISSLVKIINNSILGSDEKKIEVITELIESVKRNKTDSKFLVRTILTKDEDMFV